MSNFPINIRKLIVMILCVPFSIYLGYVAASPLGLTELAFYVFTASFLALPLLLRWHFPILLWCWNSNAVLSFLPGSPPFWLMMIVFSAMLTLVYYAVERQEKYLSVPEVIRPLLLLIAVVAVTAKLRGGIGLNAFGGAMAGGRRYIYFFVAAVGYFVLTANRIPLRRAYPYAVGFFLGAGTLVIGSLLPFIPSPFWFIFRIFPPEYSGFELMGLVERLEITRFGGWTGAGIALFCALSACYGIKGMVSLASPLRFFPFQFRGGFAVTRPWRLVFLALTFLVSLFGGYRSVLLTFLLIFAFQFFTERVFATKLFPLFLFSGIVAIAAILPFTDRLPLSFQRALSILPVKIEWAARESASASSEWRIEMWRRLLPEVPKYFFVGKGYGINTREMEMVSEAATSGQYDSMEMSILAGDYHNGPLSVIIPFGLVGVVAFLWFLLSSARVLWKNYRYGRPELLTINQFLLAYFLARVVMFFFVFGSLYSDILPFVGVVGLSISLNHGVQRRKIIAPVPVAEPELVAA